jgi:hypothetical protein
VNSSFFFPKQKNNWLLTAYCLLLIAIIPSCEKEPVPAYLYVENIEVVSGIFGSNTSNIDDVWVYRQDNPQGVYEMPVTFPIIAEGTTKLTFQAGIKMNGVATTRISYPFYSNYTVELDLVPGKVDTVRPKVDYIPATKIALLEDFETGNAFEGIERIQDAEKVFEGNVSGRMKINLGDSSVIAYNTNRFSVPFNAASVFVELNYKNNKVFNVGLRCYKNNSSQVTRVIKLNVTNKEEWSKIYVNFTPDINSIQADTYELILQYVEEGNTEPIDILFDNIKVIYL